jgi:hypothetical protein
VKKRKAPAENLTRIYLNNKYRGLPCGFHDVEVVSQGRKHVRVRPRGKAKCINFTRATWDKLRAPAKGAAT